MEILVALIGLASIAVAYLAGGWPWALLTLVVYVIVFIIGLARNWRSAFAWWLVLSSVGVVVTGGLFATSIEPSAASFLLGALTAAVIYVTAATVMFAACTEIYIVWRGANRRRAWRMAFGFILQAVSPGGMLDPIAKMFRGIQVITDGQVTYSLPPSDNPRMLGPVTLIVHVGSAVVLDRTGQITRIVGPGFYITDPFETIYSIVDLRPQTGEWRVNTLLTKDSIPLQIRFTVIYQIKVDQTALLTMGRFRIDQDAIRRAVLSTTDRDWRAHTETVARNVLCDTIAGRYLDEIYDPRGLTSGAPRVPLQHMLRRRLSQEAQGWGVEITRLTLDEISMPEAVNERMIEAWDVNWRHVVELARAITDARAIVTQATGAGQAAQINAHAEALARLQAAGIDGQTRLIEAVGAQPVALAQQQVAMIEARGEGTARLEAARIGARVQQVEAHGAALAELRAAEIEGETQRVRLTGEARARLQAAGIEMNTRQIQALSEAMADLRTAEVASETERVQLVGQARARLQASGLEMNVRQVEAMGAALAELRAAEIEGETQRVRLTGEARARLQAAGIEMNTRQIQALSEAMADLRTAEVASETERVQLVGQARARLQASGLEMNIQQVEAIGAAQAELRAAEIEVGTQYVRLKGEAQARLEVARIDRDKAKAEKDKTITEAEGKAEAERIERHAKALAEAERFRAILGAIEQKVDPKAMTELTRSLIQVLTTVDDMKAFMRFSGLGRRNLLTESIPADNDGDIPVAGGGQAP